MGCLHLRSDKLFCPKSQSQSKEIYRLPTLNFFMDHFAVAVNAEFAWPDLNQTSHRIKKNIFRPP